MTAARDAAELFRAITERDVKRVREIVRSNPEVLREKDAQGHTPVLLAAYAGAPEVIAALTEAGAPVNVYEAAAIGRTDLVKQYVGINPGLLETRAHDGWTLLHLASFFGHEATAAALLDLGADHAAVSRNEMANTPLHSAVAGRRLAAAMILLRRGADVDATAQGLTPLHLAAHAGHQPLADLLLAWGADATVQDPFENTPADLAASQGHHELAERLKRFA